MAKPSNTPSKKGQSKAKAVPAPQAKSAAKVTAKVAKNVKAAPNSAAKKTSAQTSKTAKSLQSNVPAKPAKKIAAVKPTAKSAVKAVAVKSVKVKKAAKPVTSAKKAGKKVAANTKSPANKLKAKAPAKLAVKTPKKAVVLPAKSGKQAVKVKAKPEKKAVPKTVAKAVAKAVVTPVSAPSVVGKSKKIAGSKGNVTVPPVVAEVSSNQKKAVHASSKALARTLAQLPPPPPPPPMLPEPQRHIISPAALKAFEHAVKVFNRQHYEDAKKLFESLEDKFPLDGEIIGRAQVYLQACAKKLAAVPETRPVNADELYDQGVHALNNGDYVTARQFFEKALNLNPNEPDFLYSLAAVHAQTGAPDQALDLLARSIQIKPRFRTQAFEDADFLELRSNRQFMELLGLTSPFERLENRR